MMLLFQSECVSPRERASTIQSECVSPREQASTIGEMFCTSYDIEIEFIEKEIYEKVLL